MRMMNPSVMVFRLDLVVLELAAAGIESSTPLGFLEYWGIYRAKRRCRRPPRWAQPTWARLGLQAPLVGCDPLELPSGTFLAHWMSFGPKKSTKSFAAFGLRLVLISCDVKNMQKTATGTWHYVNRLLPKNGINYYKMIIKHPRMII